MRFMTIGGALACLGLAGCNVGADSHILTPPAVVSAAGAASAIAAASASEALLGLPLSRAASEAASAPSKTPTAAKAEGVAANTALPKSAATSPKKAVAATESMPESAKSAPSQPSSLAIHGDKAWSGALTNGVLSLDGANVPATRVKLARKVVAGHAEYAGRTDSRVDVLLEVHRSGCTDSAGQSQPYSVVLYLGGRPLRGCASAEAIVGS